MYQLIRHVLKTALGAFLYIAKAILGFMWLSIAIELPFWNLLLPICGTRPKKPPKPPLVSRTTAQRPDDIPLADESQTKPSQDVASAT